MKLIKLDMLSYVLMLMIEGATAAAPNNTCILVYHVTYIMQAYFSLTKGMDGVMSILA